MTALPQRISHALRQRWLDYLGGPATRSMTLSMRRIYIVPTRAGLHCALLLLVMLAGALNYNLGLGYALTFLLGACVLVDMVATARNLAGLTLTPGRAIPVFAGSMASFEITLSGAGQRQHYALWLGFQHAGLSMQPCDVAGNTSLTLQVPAPVRGWQAAGRIRLVTRFPLGLFRAWSYWQPAQQLLVYPTPEFPTPPLPVGGYAGQPGQRQPGDDDFTGLRNYRLGDSPRQLAWRQIARHASTPELPLLARHFEGRAASGLQFDLASLPATLTLEQKLSRLCAWVLAAEARALPYSLQLDQLHLASACGAQQQQLCLRALALYAHPSTTPAQQS